jgi:hypothetical protein
VERVRDCHQTKEKDKRVGSKKESSIMKKNLPATASGGLDAKSSVGNFPRSRAPGNPSSQAVTSKKECEDHEERRHISDE